MQKKFGKQYKQNKTTAKSVGNGIANSITDKEVEQLKAQALIIAELANSMQDQSQKQFKEMMELFRLLPQTILTLNLLRQSNAVRTISTWQYVHGNFDYNKMPLAPMGCAAQIHQSSERRASWAANAIDGWYLQMSPEHYQCFLIHVKQTKSVRRQNAYHNPP